jgi:AcrR family transcriptional regulator
MTTFLDPVADAAPARPYHHGDLPAALLAAAMAILEADGIAGLTLRAVARRAGVSHMAPAHHFGDLTGLLSELAALGFQQFATALGDAAVTAAGDTAASLDRMGEAYVGFARDNPALFQLMFRSERLDPKRPALAAAMGRAGDMLTRAAGGFVEGGPVAPSLAQVAASVRAWSLVHGYALLLIDGRLDPTLARLAGAGGADATVLLRAVLGRSPQPERAFGDHDDPAFSPSQLSP